MDEQQPRSADEPTPEQLRAYEQEIRSYEEQLKRIRVEDVLLQTVVSLVNLGARRAGLVPTESGEPDPAERDLDQLRLAIDGARALLPLVEQAGGDQAGDVLKQLREALSQLQMAYAGQAGGGDSAPNAPSEQPPGGPGPAQSSGRLWVPGQ